MAENGQIIVIKKKKKGGHGGHHGGAWKVAYADFVTAMMAFFLLLWLLSAANKSTLEGISNYFKNPSGPPAAGGASTSVIEIGKNVDVSKGEGEQNRQSDRPEEDEIYTEAFKKAELAQMEEMKESIQEAIESSPTLKEFQEQIKLQITPEGLLIQILDKENRPMFDLGSAILKNYAQKIIREIAPTLETMPNRLSIGGHTDVLGYVGSNEYSNWELSVDRANAARRELLFAKLKEAKIARVVGHGSAVPFDPKNLANPANRRITIMVLKKEADDAMLKGEGQDVPKPSIAPFAPFAPIAPTRPAAASPIARAAPPPAEAQPAAAPTPIESSAPIVTETVAPASTRAPTPLVKEPPPGGSILRFR